MSAIPGPARFTAPWSRTLYISTVLLCVLIVAAAILVAVSMRRRTVLAVVACGSIVIPLILGWALAPKAFVVTGDELVVDRPLWPVRLPLTGIRSVRLLDATESRGLGLLGGTLRTFGTSGVFGYFGRFRSPTLGGFRMYATRGEGFVIVDTERGSFVLTPNAPVRFCAELRARLR